MGSNKFGQLGVGDFKSRTGPCVIGGEMVGKRIAQAACGDDFTVVATAGMNHIHRLRNLILRKKKKQVYILSGI